MSDLECVHSILSHPEVARFDEWDACSLEESREELEIALQTPFGQAGVWNLALVELLSSSEVVGCLYLRPRKAMPLEIEIGFFFHPKHQGKGLAGESARAWKELCLGQGAQKVFSRVDPRNTPSLRLLQRLGMQRTEINTRASFCKGEWCDEEVWEYVPFLTQLQNPKG